MWSYLFGKKNKGDMARKNKNINRIKNQLLENSRGPSEKFFSPTLQKLKSEKNKVKRLSSVFEDQSEASTKPIEAVQKLMTKLDYDPSPFVTRKREFAIPKIIEEPYCSNRIEELMNGLLERDRKYTKQMRAMIVNYVDEFRNIYRNTMSPEMLNSIIKDLFGPIEDIYDFHLNVFQKKLLECGSNAVEFSEFLLQMCKEGKFYAYLLFAMYERSMKFKRESYHCEFMLSVQRNYPYPYDSFGPIQQLARYHITLLDILIEMHKERVNEKVLNTVMEAEATLKKVLDDIYEARNLMKFKST